MLVAHRDSDLPKALRVHGYAALAHVNISRRGRLTDPIDELLAAAGLTRRVLATVPSTRIGLELVELGGGIVTTLPELAFEAATNHDNLTARPLPFQTRPVEVWMRWHLRHDSDPAHHWLRDQVRNMLEKLGGEPWSADQVGDR